MKKVILKNFKLAASNILSVEEKTKLMGGVIHKPGDDSPLCLCSDGTTAPMIGNRCLCPIEIIPA